MIKSSLTPCSGRLFLNMKKMNLQMGCPSKELLGIYIIQSDYISQFLNCIIVKGNKQICPSCLNPLVKYLEKNKVEQNIHSREDGPKIWGGVRVKNPGWVGRS
ncbi:unnamed protein product [Vicia faba]|uniref:Uncharacterized protein n=1 Tax=Vicia faba TaxID=3906 RepID=A0AAV1A1F7_VICFA|nr:unnamed protein product [Vicia faba]